MIEGAVEGAARMRTARVIALALAIVTITSARPADAQRVGASLDVARASANTDLHTLRGVRLDVSVPTREPRLSTRFGARYLARSGSSFGSTCVGGPYPPGICLPETLAERRALALGFVGADVHILRRLLGVSLHLDALAGAATTRDIGSRGQRDAHRAVLGIAAGTEVSAQPHDSRWRLFGGVEITGINVPGRTSCVDCWIPFDGGFTLNQWYAGVGLNARRASVSARAAPASSRARE